MKLKKGFVYRPVGDKIIAVATGALSDTFSGMFTNNSTAQFIFEQLGKETTEEGIVEAILTEYEVDESTARKDVRRVLEILRGEGLLDE